MKESKNLESLKLDLTNTGTIIKGSNIYLTAFSEIIQSVRKSLSQIRDSITAQLSDEFKPYEPQGNYQPAMLRVMHIRP